MPQAEFERYLMSLTRNLRLDNSQHDAITFELRDHLEHRLEDLTAEGIPHDQAIRTALDELGDAHDLAHGYRRIHRQQKRRRIMRSAFASMAAIGLIATLVFVFTPDPTGPYDGLASDQKPADHVRRVDTDPLPSQSFVIGEDLRFLAQSSARLDRGEGKAVHGLTAYGLQFHHDIPDRVRTRAVQSNHSEHDPWRVQLPEGLDVDDLTPNPNAALPGAEPVARPLYALLSTMHTTVQSGHFQVSVKLYDETDTLLVTREAKIQPHRPAKIFAPVNDRRHTLQQHLLVFGTSAEWGRAARYEVSVTDVDVQMPQPQPAPDRAPDAATPAAYTQWADEMQILTDAIIDLDQRIDDLREPFIDLLAAPDDTTLREQRRAERRIQDLQKLRAQLYELYSNYFFRC